MQVLWCHFHLVWLFLLRVLLLMNPWYVAMVVFEGSTPTKVMLDVSIAIEWSTVSLCTKHINFVFVYFLMYFLSSLEWDKYQWTGIGDEGATTLADPRVIKNFKTLKWVTFRLHMTICMYDDGSGEDRWGLGDQWGECLVVAAQVYNHFSEVRALYVIYIQPSLHIPLQ